MERQSKKVSYYYDKEFNKKAYGAWKKIRIFQKYKTFESLLRNVSPEDIMKIHNLWMISHCSNWKVNKELRNKLNM